MDTVLIRDVVVVVPGIMGSELVGKDGRPLWSVSKGGLVSAIRALAANDLVLPEGVGDEKPDDGVRPSRLVDSLHVIPGLWSPITGYDGLMSFLRSPRFQLMEADPRDADVMPNLIPFPYDWRLSSRYNGRRLAEVALPALEQWRRQPGMGDAKLVLLCHSMGGLVARWFAEQEGGAQHIRTIVTLGTPYRGAMKALDALVNGLEPRFGPLHLSLSAFARSLPALYQLLPQYDCLIDGDRRIGVAAAGGLGLNADMLADATAFHEAINPAGERPYALHKIVGIRQPTLTTARVNGARIEPLHEIDGLLQGGDGTVPRLSAEPVEGRGREVHEVAGQHGDLQGVGSLLDLMDGILTREQVVWQSTRRETFGVEMKDVWSIAEEPSLQVVDLGDHRMNVTLHDEAGRPVGGPRPLPADGCMPLGRLPEGGYRAVVQGRPGGPEPLGKAFLVLAEGGA